MPDSGAVKRLPRNFHKTFKPERQYISKLLLFASKGDEADYEGIAEVTGIPTGKSSGKVPAILDYCRGMGLLGLESNPRSRIKKPALTQLGRIVLLRDPFLKLELTQWVAHMNLCSPLTGADLWYQTFVRGARHLGARYKRDSLKRYLQLVYGVPGGNIEGPLLRMYNDDESFKGCGALMETPETLERKKAPIKREFATAYGAWTLSVIDAHFPDVQQVPVTELETAAAWLTIPGWDLAGANRALQLMEQGGLVDVDRHMTPWLVKPLISAELAWSRMYDDLD